jgi:hypothetical protein
MGVGDLSEKDSEGRTRGWDRSIVRRRREDGTGAQGS